MAMWNPWRGCHRYSEGCRFCYIHKGDGKRGVDTERIVRTKQFGAPSERDKDGNYKMKPGQTVYLCFSTDFLIEEADPWRGECWAKPAWRYGPCYCKTFGRTDGRNCQGRKKGRLAVDLCRTSF